MLDAQRSKSLMVIYTALCSVFLMNCSDRQSYANLTSPLPQEAVIPFKEDVLQNTGFPDQVICEGENILGANSQDPLTVYNQTLMSKDFIKDNNRVDLTDTDQILRSYLESDQKTYGIRLNHSKTGENLFSIRQFPFYGFIDGSVFSETSGGWVQCTGDIKIFRNFVGRPKKCRAQIKNKNKKDQTFSFRLNSQKTPLTLIKETEDFDIQYKVTKYFINLQVYKPKTQIEIASALTDRFYQKADYQFSLGANSLIIDCKAER